MRLELGWQKVALTIRSEYLGLVYHAEPCAISSGPVSCRQFDRGQLVPSSARAVVLGLGDLSRRLIGMAPWWACDPSTKTTLPKNLPAPVPRWRVGRDIGFPTPAAPAGERCIMSRKSTETLTGTTQTTSRVRPSMLRIVPGGESRSNPLNSDGATSQTQRKPNLPTYRDDNDDDPAPTAA